MIFSCDEVQLDETVIDRREFMVSTTESETAENIIHVCDKIPKLKSRRTFPEEKFESEVVSVECDPKSLLHCTWRVVCHYKPVIYVAEHSDEPQFQPYAGPVGKQPDGSCILSPRAWSHLAEAMRWMGWAGIGRPEPLVSSFKEFTKSYSDDTGLDLETYT